jgi:hypothetical protein
MLTPHPKPVPYLSPDLEVVGSSAGLDPNSTPKRSDCFWTIEGYEKWQIWDR